MGDNLLPPNGTQGQPATSSRFEKKGGAIWITKWSLWTKGTFKGQPLTAGNLYTTAQALKVIYRKGAEQERGSLCCLLQNGSNYLLLQDSTCMSHHDLPRLDLLFSKSKEFNSPLKESNAWKNIAKAFLNCWWLSGSVRVLSEKGLG